jgi:hypothetical protein
MKRPTVVAAGVLAALLAAAPVSGAGPITGDTIVPAPQAAGTTLLVEATVTSVVPVVPYEYSIQNECSFPGRSGSSYQRDDIVYWIDEEPGVPHTVMPIYLQSVPKDSKCKVFLMRNNTQVKGSTTSYVVD